MDKTPQYQPIQDFNRIFDILPYQKEKYQKKKSLNYFANGRWRGYSTREIEKAVNHISQWLLDEGFSKGDKLAIVPKMGHPYWLMIDFGCQQVGVVVVPIHPNLSDDQVLLILEETAAKTCITADAGLYYKIKPLLAGLNQRLKLFHLEKKIAGFFSVMQEESLRQIDFNRLNKIKTGIKADDTAVIIYTSGTLGKPKGVVLTHNNIVSNVKSILAMIPLDHRHRALSFLPFSHVFERTACLAYMAFGVSIYFSHDRESISLDFKSVRPHFCTCVPRILEKMYDFLLEQQLEKNRVKRFMIKWAMKVGEKYQDATQSKSLYSMQLFLARLFVLNHWSNQLGGRIKFMAVGAAALRPGIARLFSSAKIKTLEGYGMTEASPLITMNRYKPGLRRIGTVGMPIPGLSLRIDQPNEDGEGEIQISGPNVMHEYFLRSEATSLAFTKGGWFKTGDIGKLDKRGFLEITDRKKDIFKTSSGKYVAPQLLQNLLATSAFIQQCLIIGFNRPFVAVLIVPHFSILKSWCERQGIHWTSPPYMIHNIKIIAKIETEISHFNEQIQNHERVKGFVLCDSEWSVENGELTNSFKPIREKLTDKYKKEIEEVYKRKTNQHE